MTDILRSEGTLRATIYQAPIVLDDYTISIEPIEGGNRLNITKGSETKSLDIMNGEKGEPGADGRDGIDGRDGRDGVDGRDGLPGLNGQDGKDGVDGKDGTNGRDGIDGRDGVDGRNGIDGKNGIDGRNGRDGVDGRDGRDAVSTSNTTPTDPDVQIWLNPNGSTMQIPTMDDIPSVPIREISLAGQTREPSSGRYDIPTAKYNQSGLVKAYGANYGNSNSSVKGIKINSDGILEIAPAAYATIKQQVDSYQPIVSSTAPTAVREALAGPVTAINPAYTEAEKLAIIQRLGLFDYFQSKN